MMSKSLFVLIVILMLTACYSVKHIAGEYRGVNNVSSIEILNLKPDSSFIYKYQFVDLYEQASGTYKAINKNQILLNSNIHFTTMPLKVDETKTPDTVNYITVDVNIKNGSQLNDYECYFLINGKPYFFNKKKFIYSKRCDSLQSVPINGLIETISFGITKRSRWITNIPPALTTEVYKLKTEGNVNLISTIDCDDAYFYYKPFNNVLLKLKHNKVGPYKK